MLTKSPIVAGLSAEQIAIEGPAWYEENRVYQMLGKQVTAVDQEQKEVLLDSGEKIRYTASSTHWAASASSAHGRARVAGSHRDSAGFLTWRR